MDTSEYLEEIQKAAKGEVLGELLFLKVLNRYGGEHSQQLECLAALERHTADRMQRVLDRNNIAIENNDDSEEFTDRLIAAAPIGSWKDFVLWIHGIANPYVSRYDTLALAASSEDKDDLGFLADHERALVEFLNAEIRGEDDSIAPVRELLSVVPLKRRL